MFFLTRKAKPRQHAEKRDSGGQKRDRNRNDRVGARHEQPANPIDRPAKGGGGAGAAHTSQPRVVRRRGSKESNPARPVTRSRHSIPHGALKRSGSRV